VRARRADRGTDIVGNVVRADGQRHVTADHGGHDHQEAVRRRADLGAGQNAGNRQEQERNAERGVA
jgi:hypothetical protein